MSRKLLQVWLLVAIQAALAQKIVRRLGSFQEVFAWKQMTYNINGNILLRDRFGEDDLAADRTRRHADQVFFNNENDQDRNWNQNSGWNQQQSNNGGRGPSSQPARPVTTTARPTDEAGRFFIQYNNVPMGMEKVGNRLFVTLPRRRHGIPTTLNYIDLTRESNTRSPALTPYPNIWQGRNLTSVYRTRADQCGRLWMVDTGLLELPGKFLGTWQNPGIVGWSQT